MKKYIITGFSGFVGKHFLDYLENVVPGASVLGVDLQAPQFDLSKFPSIKCDFKKLNLLNKDDLSAALCQFNPDYILHLASFSSVAFSWQNPVDSFKNNTNIFLNLIESVRELKLKSRILSIGSSEEYGDFDEKDLPLKETYELKPSSPYAVARVSQELLSKIYVSGFNLDIMMTRSFNHMGSGQRDTFVIPSFARQLVQFKAQGLKKAILHTGNVDVVRDFTDVRDVVRAYFELFEKGKPGEIYNICSGKGISLREIIEKFAQMLGLEISIEIDKKLLRPNDYKIIIGSNDKINKEIGWQPSILFEQTLKDVLKYW